MTAPSEAARDFEWRDPPADLSLMTNEVHVWRASLRCAEPQTLSFRQTLTPDEQARADHFRFKKDRDHFVVARGLLRAILARYLRQRPDRLRFRYSAYGKPSLGDDVGGGALRFNVTHSHGLALFAVASGREVGVDLEWMRADFAHLEIACQFFSAGEVGRLKALPPEMWGPAFFNCWTRKEAYIKARGEGLSHPLDEFEVALTPGEKPALLSTAGDSSEASRWSMHELSPAPSYKAAIVVEGHDYRLQCWNWREPQTDSANGS